MGPGSPIDDQYRQYLKSKSPKDLAPIFQELAPKLQSAARRAGLDGQGAEDIVQETFLAVIEAEDRFDPERSFLAWIRGIALRQIRAERRRWARLRSLLQSEHESEAANLAGPDPAVASVSSTDFQRKVEEAIIALSEGNKMVVRAALFEGLSVDEMAERFDLSKGAVSVRLHRGLSRLRTRLKESSSLAVVTLGSNQGRGLEPIWERLTREIQKVNPAKPAASSVFSTGGLAVGILLTAVVGAALWVGTRPSGNGSADAGTRQPGAEALAEAGRGTDSGNGTDGAAAGPVPSVTVPPVEANGIAAAPAAPEQAKEIRGVVVPRGVSLAPEGAQIFALGSNPGIVLPESPMVPIATTDKDGVYWLSAADLETDRTPILIVRHGTEIGWVDVPESAIDDKVLPELRLVPELVVAAKVVDASGRPVEGVNLSAWTRANRFMARAGERSNQTGVLATRPYRHLFGGVTDENGLGLVRGLYGADTPGLVTACAAWKNGYACATVALRSPGGRRIELDITLLETENLSLEGRVVDESGEAIGTAEATFLLRGESDVATSVLPTIGPDGQWSVPSALLDDYPIQLQISAPGFVSRRYYVQQAEELPSAPVVITLPLARRLKGRVVDEANRPLSGANVTVAAAGEFQDLVANGDGEFESAAMESAPVLITVAATDSDGVKRSAQFPLNAEETDVDLILPKPDRLVDELSVHLPASLPNGAWSRAQMHALDAKGYVGALLPNSLAEGEAVFQSVPGGQWLFCGISDTGAQTLETITVAPKEEEAGMAVQLEDPPEGGSIEYVLGPLPEGAPASFTVFARRANVPRLPAWMQVRAGGLRRELMRQVNADSVGSIPALLPGDWELSAAGEGWRTQTQRIAVTAGQSARADLLPAPSSTVHFVGPPTASAGLTSIEVRRQDDEPWSQVGLGAVTADVETNLVVQLAPGEWSWRATFQTIRQDEQFVHMTPPAHGTVTVVEGQPIKIQL